MPNVASLTRPSPGITQNLDRGISDFLISGQSPIKLNCHNSRISDDIDTKLGPVTKLDTRNKRTSKKFEDDVMQANCDTNVTFFNFWPICSNPEAGFPMHSP